MVAKPAAYEAAEQERIKREDALAQQYKSIGCAAVKAAAPYTYRSRPANDSSRDNGGIDGDIDKGRFID
jgi:hypothetical protein